VGIGTFKYSLDIPVISHRGWEMLLFPHLLTVKYENTKVNTLLVGSGSSILRRPQYSLIYSNHIRQD